MKNKTTLRDYELLSSYLDNQLGSQERAHLESRLIADPELQKILNELNKTRLLLSSMPKLRAPRNYFVTEKDTKTARMHGFQRVAPAYGIVSAVATILLVMLIFGNRLITSTSQVASAPVSMVAITTEVVQKEVEQNKVSTSIPTQEPPLMMKQAPAVASTASPTPEILAGRGEQATPTTIFLNAMPPASTQEAPVSIMNDQTLTTTFSCDGSIGIEPYPTNRFVCPSPTIPPSEFIEAALPTSTSASVESPTPTQTNTSTPTPTTTSTPTVFPSAPPTYTAIPTETPTSTYNIASESMVVESTLPVASNQIIGSANPSPTMPEPDELPRTNPNFDFIQYLILAIELSLAGVAIIAGIIFIIIRSRASR